MEHGAVLILTDEEFDSAIQESINPVVVDFWAAWCGPCMMMAEPFVDLADRRSDITFVKVNVDENAISSATAEIKSIPAFVIYRNGSEVGRIIGAMPIDELEQAIDLILAQS